MSVTSTSVFDKLIFDGPETFDTKLQYLVGITVTKQIFDDAVYDSDIFDTTRGGVIDFTDSAAQSLQAQRTITDPSISLSGTPARILASLRSITASSINLSDSVARVLAGLRNISQSISIGETIGIITPTVNRWIRDLGAIFDVGANNDLFDSEVFDTTIQSHRITDSLARSEINRKTISAVAITLSDNVSRIYGSVRGLTESISLNDSLSRLYGSLRNVTESISLSDSAVSIEAFLRSITATSTSLSDGATRI